MRESSKMQSAYLVVTIHPPMEYQTCSCDEIVHHTRYRKFGSHYPPDRIGPFHADFARIPTSHRNRESDRSLPLSVIATLSSAFHRMYSCDDRQRWFCCLLPLKPATTVCGTDNCFSDQSGASRPAEYRSATRDRPDSSM